MLSIVLAALRSRRSSTVAVWLLACLVVAGAVGAPFDVFGARASVTAQDVREAPPPQRMIILTQDAAIVTGPRQPPEPSVIDDTRSALRSVIAVPNVIEVAGLRVDGSLDRPVDSAVPVASRSDVCAHVAVSGRCPAEVGDVMLSRSLARQLGVAVGGTIRWPAASQSTRPPNLHIVGLYDVRNLNDPYWGKGLFAATAPVGSPNADAMFVTEATIRAYAQSVTVERLLIVTPATVATNGVGGTGPDAVETPLANLNTAVGNSFTIDEDFEPLAARIASDQQSVTNTVPVLAAELVLSGWFALYLVLRAIAAGRRADVGLALLRGTSRFGMWRLFGPQNALPVLAAVPFGAAAGYAGARWLAGPVRDTDRPLAMAIAGAATGAVVLGALAAAALAERASRRGSIVEMLRRTPARRRGWRADAADAAVVALALFALVQLKIGGTGTDRAVGVAAATPALVAVAIALIAARLLAPVAARLVPAALRSGRVTGLLSAAHFARRPGLDRVLALLIVAVALVGYAVLGWHTASSASRTRAVEELGADRVLQIRDATADRVLAVTRGADPSGHYVMAAATYANGKVLAVDSDRLATVLIAGPQRPSGVRLAAALHTPQKPVVRIMDGPLRIDVKSTTLPAHPVDIVVDATDANGSLHAIRFGPLTTTSTSYRATVDGCATGCAFVDFRIVDTPTAASQGSGTVSGVSVAVSSLRPDDGDTPVRGGAAEPGDAVTEIGLADFADQTRWRTSFGDATVGPALSTGPDGLHVTLGNGESLGAFETFDPRVFPADVSLPVPVVVAGAPATPARPGLPTVALSDDLRLPDRVAATATVLPQLGTSGAYIDLPTVLRLAGGSGADAVPQIWLRGDTPTSVMAKLRAAGLLVTSDTTVGSAVAGYERQAPFAALRFGLAIATIAMLVGAIALIALATVERPGRAAELAALRRDGLGARAARATALASYLSLVGVAVVIGLLAVVIARLLAGKSTVFADRYTIPPAPHASATGWLLVVLTMALPLAVAAGYVARGLVRASRRRPGAAA